MRCVVLATVLMAMCGVVSAQNYHTPPPDDYYNNNDYGGDYSELVIGHGFLPSQQMFRGSAHGLSYNNIGYSGAVYGSYRYYVTDYFAFGVSMVFERERGTWHSTSNLLSPYGSGNFYRSAFTIAPEMMVTYCDYAGGLISLYGTAGIGYTFRREMLTYGYGDARVSNPDAKTVHMNGYISPLGIKAGRQLSGFFELGLGYKGLFNYGLTYRF